MARPAKQTKFGRFLHNHPHWLELAYDVTVKLFGKLDPVIEKIGYAKADKLLKKPEHWVKSALFDCRMCGQCVLHSTGMTCPMTCPKTLRNGPCGGVRQDGGCEVFPEMQCVWVAAFAGSQKMPLYGAEIQQVNPPVNGQLDGQSAWITQLTGQDRSLPKGWVALERVL
ncbi:MAG TPA: hypothetical protein ENJ56_00855 [Anaerolineae bacterium]|nr:hypothetical protein [Anaerolineae bacterium]